MLLLPMPAVYLVLSPFRYLDSHTGELEYLRSLQCACGNGKPDDCRSCTSTNSSPAESMTSLVTETMYFLSSLRNSIPVALTGVDLGSNRMRETSELVRTTRFFLPAYGS